MRGSKSCPAITRQTSTTATMILVTHSHRPSSRVKSPRSRSRSQDSLFRCFLSLSPPSDSKKAEARVPFSYPSNSFRSSPYHLYQRLTIPDLLKQVFSHQSLFERVRGRFEEPVDKPAKHYEKLEHVGDSILGSMVTTWLHETRPRLTPGSATVR